MGSQPLCAAVCPISTHERELDDFWQPASLLPDFGQFGVKRRPRNPQC